MSMQQDLYQQVILDHNKNPRNYGRLQNPTHHAEGYNPLCGDHLLLDVIVRDNVIQDVRFEGDGCAISKASASMMTAALKGKTLAEASQMFEEFQSLVTGKLNPETDVNHLGKLKIFSGIWHFPARVKCAVLSWHALKGALDKAPVVSTE